MRTLCNLQICRVRNNPEERNYSIESCNGTFIIVISISAKSLPYLPTYQIYNINAIDLPLPNEYNYSRVTTLLITRKKLLHYIRTALSTLHNSLHKSIMTADCHWYVTLLPPHPYPNKARNFPSTGRHAATPAAK